MRRSTCFYATPADFHALMDLVEANETFVYLLHPDIQSPEIQVYDHAAVETFFKTIKAELLWQRSWPTRRAAEMAIFEYVNGFYNPRRRRSALGWKSPLAFEAQAA